MATRRWILALTPALLLAPRLAFAQSLSLEELLDRITSALGSASSMTVGISVSVAGLGPDKVRADERAAVVASLAEFDDALARVNITHEQAVDDIDDYIRSVRNNGFVPQTHAQMWSNIKTDLNELVRIVTIARNMERSNTWLSSALAQAQLDELDRVLLGKTNMLRQLSSLPAPSTPSEIDRLAALKTQFADLLKRQQELRLELRRARARFV